MPRWFNSVTDAAKTGAKAPIRALQAWQFLIGKAHNRQIVKYEELRRIMGYGNDRPLRTILGCIMHYCEQQHPKLPPLSIIVVNQKGIPGKGFNVEKPENYHRRREEVFSYPWFKMVPPTVEEFREALSSGIADKA